VKACLSEVGENDLSLISAGVAFFGMLSLFPALAAVIALLGLIADPSVVIAQLENTKGLMPGDVYDIINVQVTALVTARPDTLGWASLLSFLVALWSARAGVGAMIIGLNNVYGRKNRHTAWHYFRALLMTLGLVLVAIVALLTLVVAPVALAFIPLGAVGALVADLVRYGIAITVLFAGLGVFYHFGPNRRPKRVQWLSFGAVLAVLSWVLLSVAFSFYVTNFGNYNQVYGSIGAVIAMLIWMWISSFLVLLGGSVNAQIDLRRPAVEDAD
jgi:membrane protein